MIIRFGCSPHFHIHWVGQRLDWECFDTREDAQRRAVELAHPGETFTIEEVSTKCPMRERFRSGQDEPSRKGFA